MSTTTGYERHSAVAERALKSSIHQTPRWYWYYGAAALVAVPALLLGLPNRSIDGIAQLEQLAPMIERASALSPHARETINRVVERQSALAGSNNETVENRRRNAIERVTSAMQAKQVASAGDRVNGP